jgi:trans-2,3-dihydro-3-hydroxyanthranilate isomerase
MPSLRYVVCDVFTARPFEGNQLAVFTDAREIPEESLQALARELKLSETVFVYPPVADGHVRIRIFTPRSEVPFAGHPTLGTAFVLGGPLQLPEIVIETGKGPIAVALEREQDGRLSFGRMEQPIPTIEAAADAEELLGAVGVEDSALPVEIYDNGIRHAYIALASEEEVARLRPDATRLERFGVLGTNCFAGSGRRWKTRNFVPGAGIVEDPATGSAAGPLALHLARHGVISFGEEIEISQGVEISRPSTLYACVEGTRERVDRILVGGSAVIVARGEFRL